MTSESHATRRRFLQALGAGAAGATAGCSTVESLFGDGSTTVPGEFPEYPAAIFRRNNRRTGVQPDETVADEVDVEWRFAVNSGSHTAAKSSFLPTPDGNFIVCGDDGIVHSLTPGGEERWSRATDTNGRGIHGTPVVANGTAYVGDYDGILHAFDVEDGTNYWSTDLGDAIGSSPAYYDGTVYIAVEYAPPDGSVFGVDAATGDVTWETKKPTDHPHCPLGLDPEGGYLVLGANDGVIRCWSYPDYEYLWDYETDGAIKGPVAIHDGTAIVGSWDTHVYRMDLETGEPVWAYPTGGKVMSGASVDTRSDTVFIGSHDGYLYALDLQQGEARWRFDTGGSIIGCPTVTKESVLFGSYDDTCYCIERTGDRTPDADPRWAVESEGVVTSSPVVVDGAVYYTERAPNGGENGEKGYAYKLVPK